MIWKIILGLLLALAAMLIWGAIAKNNPEWEDQKRARNAIELCREAQKKASGDAAALSIIVPSCEKFEADFRAKYGKNP